MVMHPSPKQLQKLLPLRTPSLAALASLGKLIALCGCAGAIGGCGVGDSGAVVVANF